MPHRPRLRLLSLLTTALLGGLLLTACGGGEGSATTASVQSVDATAPVVTLASADSEPVVKQSRITVTGSVADNIGVQSVQLTLNGQTSTVTLSSGSFTATVDLKAGRNVYTLTALDAAGNAGTQQGSVYLGHRVAAGNSHSGAIVDGALYTWGRNNYGQTGLGFWSTLANNPTTHPTAPTQTLNAASFVALAFNQNHSVGIDANGQLWSWGEDTDGQLGRGTEGQTLCGTSANLKCRLDMAAVPGMDSVVSVAAGYSHVLALKADGTVWAFGANSQGQLGNGTTTASATPVQVTWNAEDAERVGRIVQVSGSSMSSYALDDKGQLWGWGRNSYANLGQGTTTTAGITVPTLVPMPDGVRIASVANGRDHVLALTTDGKVYAWGLNASSQVGFNGYVHKGTSTAWPSTVLAPRSLPAMETLPAVEVYANGNTSYVRRADGKIYQWGLYGVTADTGTTNYSNLDEPEDRQPTLGTMIDVSTGGLHQVGLRQDGTVFSWGWSFEGSLGGGASVINTWMYNTPVTPVFP